MEIKPSEEGVSFIFTEEDKKIILDKGIFLYPWDIYSRFVGMLVFIDAENKENKLKEESKLKDDKGNL
jgi:hypothetical protein